MRVEINLGVTVLAASAGLANVFALGFGVLADGLAIRHLRLADVGLDLVLAHHAVDNDFQMQLAHAADDGLSAVGIGVNFKGRIFLGQAAERHAHLFLIRLGLRFDRNRDHGNRKRDRLQRNGMIFVANRVARTHILQSHSRADVARQNLADLFALVGVHLQQTPNALGLGRANVPHRIAGLELARSTRG